VNGIEVGFIGAGNMATAMIKGITSTKTLPGSKIMVINKSNKERIWNLCDQYGVKEARDYRELVASSPVIIIAVKPQQITEVLESIYGLVAQDKLVISIAAGIMINMIESALGKGVPVIRAMPNTPAQAGEGVTVLCASFRVTGEQKTKAESIFSSIGSTFWIDEIYMDAVTALSGSGPAYFYRLAQEMTEVAVEMGLERQLSEQLARQTLIGAGYLLRNTQLPIKDLIRQIASPDGTTEAALHVFESNRLGLLVEEAMGKALRRSEEIASTYADKGIKERSAITRARRIVVKIGSTTVTDDKGVFNEALLRNIVKQISAIQSEGREIVLVSSGAMAAGKGKLGDGKACTITEKQVLAAVGQGLLMKSYETLFDEYGLTVGQVLLTREDLSSPKRSSLCKDTLDEMLEKGIIPIVNENDTVAVEEIRFGDNDTLSARVATLISADLLILLTDTNGFYDKDPRNNEDANLISTIRHIDASILSMAQGTENSVGTGGMITKVWAANIALEKGIPTVIANGNEPRVIESILEGRLIGTLFI
jgi:pyrroline-5-carboxylate reductase